MIGRRVKTICFLARWHLIIGSFILTIGTVFCQIGYTERGKASYYADHFHGRPTASGEPYNKYDLTAAHKELAFGTQVKVTNLKNGKSVIVRINDRGPFKPGRIIDLSRAAAEKLDMIADGEVPVKIEVIGLPSTSENNTSSNPNPPQNKKTKEKKKKKNTISFLPNHVYKLDGEEIKNIHYAIQVGSFTDRHHAIQYAGNHPIRPVYIWVKKENHSLQYKVIVGNFQSYEEGKKALQSWKNKYNIDGFVVKIK